MEAAGKGSPTRGTEPGRIPGWGSARHSRRPDAALVLLGHGSTLNADSSRPVREQAARMREAGLFAEVATGFWKEQPAFCGCLRQVLSPRVFVVPMFISEGYFTEEVIPRELGMIDTSGRRVRHRRIGAQEFHYCRPVGTHASMTQLILERAREIVTRFPGPSGRTGPSPLPRSMPLAEGREWSAIGVLGLGAGILVVIIFEAAFLGEQAGYSALLRVRLASLGGGFLLVFLAVRTVTSYLHWNAMPVLEAGLVAQEAAWREGAVEMGAIHRWLTWMRVGTRRGAERKWRILSRRRAGA